MQNQINHIKKIIHETRLINDLPFQARQAERTMQYPKLVKALEASVRCLDRLTANEMRMVELRAELRVATNEYKDLLRQLEKAEPLAHSVTGTLTKARLKVDKLLEQIEQLLNNSAKDNKTLTIQASVSFEDGGYDFEGMEGLLR